MATLNNVSWSVVEDILEGELFMPSTKKLIKELVNGKVEQLHEYSWTATKSISMMFIIIAVMIAAKKSTDSDIKTYLKESKSTLNKFFGLVYGGNGTKIAQCIHSSDGDWFQQIFYKFIGEREDVYNKFYKQVKSIKMSSKVARATHIVSLNRLRKLIIKFCSSVKLPGLMAKDSEIARRDTAKVHDEEPQNSYGVDGSDKVIAAIKKALSKDYGIDKEYIRDMKITINPENQSAYEHEIYTETPRLYSVYSKENSSKEIAVITELALIGGSVCLLDYATAIAKSMAEFIRANLNFILDKFGNAGRDTHGILARAKLLDSSNKIINTINNYFGRGRSERKLFMDLFRKKSDLYNPSEKDISRVEELWGRRNEAYDKYCKFLRKHRMKELKYGNLDEYAREHGGKLSMDDELVSAICELGDTLTWAKDESKNTAVLLRQSLGRLFEILTSQNSSKMWDKVRFRKEDITINMHRGNDIVQI